MTNTTGAGSLLKDMRLYIRALSNEEITELYDQYKVKNPFLRREKELKLSNPLPTVPTIPLAELHQFLEKSKGGWGLDRLFQISELVVGYCEETKQNPLSADIDAIHPKNDELSRYTHISDLSIEEIRFRFSVSYIYICYFFYLFLFVSKIGHSDVQ